MPSRTEPVLKAQPEAGRAIQVLRPQTRWVRADVHLDGRTPGVMISSETRCRGSGSFSQARPIPPRQFVGVHAADTPLLIVTPLSWPPSAPWHQTDLRRAPLIDPPSCLRVRPEKPRG